MKVFSGTDLVQDSCGRLHCWWDLPGCRSRFSIRFLPRFLQHIFSSTCSRIPPETLRESPRSVPGASQNGPSTSPDRLAEQFQNNNAKSALHPLRNCYFFAHFGTRPEPPNRPKIVLVPKSERGGACFCSFLWRTPFLSNIRSIFTRFYTKNRCFFYCKFSAPRTFFSTWQSSEYYVIYISKSTFPVFAFLHFF